MTKSLHLSRLQCCVHKEYHPEGDLNLSAELFLKYLVFFFLYNSNPNKRFEMQQKLIAIIFVLGETLTQ